MQNQKDEILADLRALTRKVAAMSFECTTVGPPINTCREGYLDCSKANPRIYARDSITGNQGELLTELPCNQQSFILLDWVGECGEYLGDNVPVEGRLEVTNGVGSEVFDTYLGGITNRYIYTPSGPGVTDFSFGTNDADGNLVICDFSLTVDDECSDKLIDFGDDQQIGQVSTAEWQAGLPNGTSVQNSQLAGIANGGIRQVLPTNGVDPRFALYSTMPDSRCYRVVQTLLWETNPADFGGQGNFATAKLGWGLGSNNYVSGGTLDCSGSSIRWIQRAGNLVGYSYSCDRPGQFGEDLNNGTVVPITPGTPQVLTMEMCKNTGSNSDGTLLMQVDGVTVHQESTIQWQTSDHSITDCRYDSFFGGSGSDWAPQSPQTINVYDASYTALP